MENEHNCKQHKHLTQLLTTVITQLLLFLKIQTHARTTRIIDRI